MASNDRPMLLLAETEETVAAKSPHGQLAAEFKGRLNAGDVELPYLTADDEDGEDEEDEGTMGPEQQLIEGAATILGLNEIDARSDGERGGDKNKPSEGIIANIVRAVISAPFYPIKLVQVLIQLGHEPTPPEQRYSFVFRQYLYYYPGLFGYARRIVRKDGWRALYRGVGGSIFTDIVHLSTVSIIRPTVNHFISKLPLQTATPDSGGDVPDIEPENVETIRSVLVRAFRTFLSNSITSVAVEVIVHPFHIISIRMIAQHVGKEGIYTSVWQSMREIYREEGLRFLCGHCARPPRTSDSLCHFFVNVDLV